MIARWIVWGFAVGASLTALICSVMARPVTPRSTSPDHLNDESDVLARVFADLGFSR